MANKWLSCALFAVVALAACVDGWKDSHILQGRAGIVHLFEWKFEDIALECERFLGPYGFGGVQVSPIHECLVVSSPFRPWWERYQVISYQIASRSGSELEFADMVRRCRDVGIRIYVDVVINHMTGDHPYAVGTAGTTADPISRTYPGVPYNVSHFHTPCSIGNYGDANQVRNCELVGLHDLNHSLDYVRSKIIEFLNNVLSHGVAGFRLDAAKHMWPADLKYIIEHLDNLNQMHGFPPNSKPFIFQEIIDLGGEGISWSEYSDIGRATEFKYGAELGKAFKGNNKLMWLNNFGTPWNLMPSKEAVVFVDNHDNQRGHGGGGHILTYKDGRLYKMAVAFMLSWPYGVPRLMSSFHFEDTDAGPPHNDAGEILPVLISEDLTCINGWVCEHRWRQIYNMIGFRIVVHETNVSGWWDNGNNQIAFCRGNKGFIAFNGEYGVDLKEFLNTCLPQGVYCDIISGSKRNGQCTGKSVSVSADGKAYIHIAADEQDGILAIHLKAKL